MHDHLPEMQQRRSIRLKEYDYAQNGAYFITLCAHQRECLFGEFIVGARRTKGRQSASSLRLGGIDTAVPLPIICGAPKFFSRLVLLIISHLVVVF